MAVAAVLVDTSWLLIVVPLSVPLMYSSTLFMSLSASVTLAVSSMVPWAWAVSLWVVKELTVGAEEGGFTPGV